MIQPRCCDSLIRCMKPFKSYCVKRRFNSITGFLQALLEFLSKVVSRERKNKMNLWAVATIMAPNLFLHKAVPSRLTEGTEKGQAEKAADVMRLLIRYQDLLWTVGLPKESGRERSQIKCGIVVFLSADPQLPHGPGTQAEREQQPALPVLRPPHQEPAEEDPHRRPGETRQNRLGGECLLHDAAAQMGRDLGKDEEEEEEEEDYLLPGRPQPHALFPPGSCSAQ